MKKKSFLGESMLVIAAIIWGFAFVAQSIGGENMGSFTFNAIRMFIGGITLIPFIIFNRKKSKTKTNKSLIIGGILCGTILFFAANLQQVGLEYSSASKAGFLTAQYIIIVPLIGIFFKKRPSITLWISIFIALFGIYLLCVTDEIHITPGDFLLLLGALGFSLHILVIDYFSPIVDAIKLSCIQFFVCGIITLFPMFLFEDPSISAIKVSLIPLLYTGVLSCGIAYTFQIIGQKSVNPMVSALIMSLESVFAAIGGWIILGESLTSRELTGCVCLFIAIILAQLPVKSKDFEIELNQ